MPRLFLVVGRAARTAPPQVVYCGEDGAAAAAALESSPLPLVEYFRNPQGGIRKQVLGAAANAAALAASAAQGLESKAAVAQACAERDAEITSLRAALKSAKKKPGDDSP